MPSISKAKLDELEASVEDAHSTCATWRQRAEEAQAKLRSFDAILDKIRRAANGQPLTDNQHSGRLYPSMMNAGFDPHNKPSAKERESQERRDQNERIVALESRLAAVNAVAEFAREHKA